MRESLWREKAARVSSTWDYRDAQHLRKLITSSKWDLPLWVFQDARLLILLVIDMFGVILAASIAYFAWARLVLHQPASIYVDVLPLMGLLPLGYAAADLYPGLGMGAAEMLRRFTWCTSFGFLSLAASGFALKLPTYFSRVTLALAWLISLVSVPTFRFLLLSVTARWQWWNEPAVIVGTTAWVKQSLPTLRSVASVGYRVVGVLTETGSEEEINNMIGGLPLLGGAKLASEITKHGLRVAIVGDDPDISTLDDLQRRFRHVVILREHGNFPIEGFRAFNIGTALGIEFTNNLLRWPNKIFKRMIDLVVGTLTLLISLPPLVVAGLLIWLFDGRPILYSQSREGLDGKQFAVWKLRTMYKDAEDRLQPLLVSNVELRRQWQRHRKLAKDPRVLAGVGTFLRRFSIDELPQLWNVVRGQMSLVGPRPFPSYHLECFPSEFRRLRQSIRPGLTGVWQVMVRSKGSLEQQQLYDAYYIRNWSVWLDLYLLARTVSVVVTGRGAS